MNALARCIVLLFSFSWSAGAAHPLDIDRTGLGWTPEEVARASAPTLALTLVDAERQGLMGCQRGCAEIQRVWRRLLAAAPERAGLRLHVVRLSSVKAFSLPSGDVVLGEDFALSETTSEAELAFVLAHEIAHVLLQHERQSLTTVRALLPAVDRTVGDIYTELEFNHALLRQAASLMQDAELEADEFALQLAALALYPPGEQLGFLERLARTTPAAGSMLSTHPQAAQRLAVAKRSFELASSMWRHALEVQAVRGEDGTR